MTLELTADELALQTRAREFAKRIVEPRAAEIDTSGEYPWDVVKALAAAGFCGMPPLGRAGYRAPLRRSASRLCRGSKTRLATADHDGQPRGRATPRTISRGCLTL